MAQVRRRYAASTRESTVRTRKLFSVLSGHLQNVSEAMINRVLLFQCTWSHQTTATGSTSTLDRLARELPWPPGLGPSKYAWWCPFLAVSVSRTFLYPIGDPIQLRLPKPRSARLRPVLFRAKLRHRKEFQLQQQERPPPRGPTTEYMYQVGIKNVCVWSAIA